MKDHCCLNCEYCWELDYSFNYQYEGYCVKLDIYLRTIEDRLCENFEEKDAI